MKYIPSGVETRPSVLRLRYAVSYSFPALCKKACSLFPLSPCSAPRRGYFGCLKLCNKLRRAADKINVAPSTSEMLKASELRMPLTNISTHDACVEPDLRSCSRPLLSLRYVGLKYVARNLPKRASGGLATAVDCSGRQARAYFSFRKCRCALRQGSSL